MRLVCVIGIDGAGKTTLARRTVAELRSQDRPARYLYGRTYPMLSRLLMFLGRATILRKQDLWRDYSSYTESKQAAMRSPLLASVYASAVLVDYYVEMWVKLLPVVFTDQIVVMDRYVHDTLVNELAAQLDFDRSQLARATRAMARLLPRPSLAFLIDLPPEIAFSRKDDVPHVDYLRTRREYYLQLAAEGRLEILDGEQPVEDLVDAVVSRATASASAAFSRATR
jgi:thymidylate kinase